MTDRELNRLIEKHDNYRLTGKPFDYKDHLKLFDELLSRWKYDQQTETEELNVTGFSAS